MCVCEQLVFVWVHHTHTFTWVEEHNQSQQDMDDALSKVSPLQRKQAASSENKLPPAPRPSSPAVRTGGDLIRCPVHASTGQSQAGFPGSRRGRDVTDGRIARFSSFLCFANFIYSSADEPLVAAYATIASPLLQFLCFCAA